MSRTALAELLVAPATTDEDLLDVAAVRHAVDPDADPTLDGMRHTLATFPHALYLIARLPGEAVACAYAGSFPGTESDVYLHANVSVVPDRRGAGIGSRLYGAVSEHARAAGKRGLTVETSEEDPGSLAWLERRGFVEVERQKAVALDLDSAQTADPVPPSGIVVVSRAERPGLEEGMYRVGLEAGRDIPGLDAEHEPTFEQWRSFEIERPSRRPELCFVALAGEDVIGFASLDVPGRSGRAYHGLTCTARAWRGRGVGEALKRSQIAAARRAGLRRLVTESEERNVPMRRLNEKLGYRPIPGMVVLRGPLAPSSRV
jgi:GNAT superfamily N-acetyltransferase